ncbi:hypothetical protein [Peribacillus butanolivorans]|uniref:hypothetical protein n=1 Tax=Peribacillus butanolivorans TaxID=421767 RepID=UPI0037F59068
MKNILIITTADMSLQSGNVVLINRRAEEMFKQFQIKTTCLILENEGINVKHNAEGIEYIKLTSKHEIKNYILTHNPQGVIFYGFRSYSYISYVKKVINKAECNTKILLDIQGALEEGVEYSKGFNWFANFVKFSIKKILLFKYLNLVDGAFVVSDELMEYCYSYLKKSKKSNFKIFKIRCGINKVINSQQKKEWRKEIRNQWNINDDTVVLVFSGYRMPWQNIDKIIDLFKRYDKIMDNVYFAFFCNLDKEFEDQIKTNFKKDNYKTKFLSFDEYFKYLCACDVGFLIRDNNITNKVAFPNKFSDYLNAGLTVAINNTLPEPYRILEQGNVKYINIEQDLNNHIEIMKERQANINQTYKKTEQLCKEELLYSSQIAKIEFEAFFK